MKTFIVLRESNFLLISYILNRDITKISIFFQTGHLECETFSYSGKNPRTVSSPARDHCQPVCLVKYSLENFAMLKQDQLLDCPAILFVAYLVIGAYSLGCESEIKIINSKRGKSF